MGQVRVVTQPRTLDTQVGLICSNLQGMVQPWVKRVLQGLGSGHVGEERSWSQA